MGAKPSIQFFEVKNLTTLKRNSNLKKALDIFTRQPYPQPGYKNQSLREMQKTFLMYTSTKLKFFTEFLEMVRQTMPNSSNIQVQFASNFDMVIDHFTLWYNTPSLNILLLGSSEKEIEHKVNEETVTESHATAFIFQKNEGQLLLTYFNSHSRQGTNHLGKRVSTFIRESVDENVQAIFRLEDTCPVFQTGYQGGNCPFWQLLILCLFMQNPQYISDPNVIYKWVEKQNPDYLIMMFEMFVWYKFGTHFPDYFQELYNDSADVEVSKIGLYEDFFSRFLLNNKLAITWCPVYVETQCNDPVFCEVKNNKCEYKEYSDATVLELKDHLQALIARILKVSNVKQIAAETTSVESYSSTEYTLVNHYVCSLVIDMITFLIYFEGNSSENLTLARIYSTMFQVNMQCPQVFDSFLKIFSWPTFEKCLDYVFEKKVNTSMLQYHCPTAAKFRYLLSEGREGNLDVPPESTVLYMNPTLPPESILQSLLHNITFSSNLIQINGVEGESLPPFAVVYQPIHAYNYVLFKKPSDLEMNYLDKAMWNGFLQQMTLAPISIENIDNINVELGAIPYFASLPVIVAPPNLIPL